MVLSFRDKRTASFAEGEVIPEFQGFDRQAWKCLEILDAVVSLADLDRLRRNRVEALKADRTVRCSIRINMQWRICFEWPQGTAGPFNVEVVH